MGSTCATPEENKVSSIHRGKNSIASFKTLHKLSEARPQGTAHGPTENIYSAANINSVDVSQSLPCALGGCGAHGRCVDGDCFCRTGHHGHRCESRDSAGIAVPSRVSDQGNATRLRYYPGYFYALIMTVAAFLICVFYKPMVAACFGPATAPSEGRDISPFDRQAPASPSRKQDAKSEPLQPLLR